MTSFLKKLAGRALCRLVTAGLPRLTPPVIAAADELRILATLAVFGKLVSAAPFSV